MFARCRLQGLLLLCLGSALVGCSAPQGLDSIQVTPPTQALAVGQTAQFTATGTYGNGKHPSTQNITSLVTWSSTTAAVATVDASGVVTAVSAGTTTITASATAFNGPTSSSATLTTTAAPEPLLALTIIPGSITVQHLQDTGQFLAIGTFSANPIIRDVTNTVTWFSSQPNVFPVTTNNSSTQGRENAGVASAFGTGTATITAEATGSNGTIRTASVQFSCGVCSPPAPALLSTLTVYNEGLNTTSWLVTAPSATGTPNVLHCGPGASSGDSVCSATYPVGTIVTLTAPKNGAKFGGWSSTCTPNPAIPDPVGPNTCTVNLSTSDATVGAIFN